MLYIGDDLIFKSMLSKAKGYYLNSSQYVGIWENTTLNAFLFMKYWLQT